MLLLAGDSSAQLLTRSAEPYPVGSSIILMPSNATKQFVGVEAMLSRENWPGFGQLATAASASATTIRLRAGEGAGFPPAGGELVAKSGGRAEHLRLLARSGDVITVERGYRGTARSPLGVGATIRLNDLIEVRWERTPDGGATWVLHDAFTCPGGTLMTAPGGGLETRCGTGLIEYLADGAPAVRDGDLRVIITTRVPLTTAITARAYEAGQIAALPSRAPPHHSVAHDAEANKVAPLSAVTSKTLSAKTSAGTNRLGILHLPYYDGVGTDLPSAPTWGGTGMTEVVGLLDSNGVQRAKLYRTTGEPATSASDIVVTWTDAAYGAIGASSYNDVDQTTPIGGTNTAEGTGSPCTINQSSAVDEMAVDACLVNGPTSVLTIGAGQSAVQNESDGMFDVYGAGSNEAGAASVTLSWTFTGAVDWTTVSATMNEDTGGASPPKRLLTLGIGVVILGPALWRWHQMRSGAG